MKQAEYRGFIITPHEYPTQGGELFWQHPHWDGDPEDSHLYGSAGSFREANEAIDEFIETHGELDL